MTRKVNKAWTSFIFMLLILALYPVFLFSQNSSSGENYLWTDSERSKLQIIVHIWGEVNKPGQFVVPDGTDVLQLISLAGGPNEYSSLGNVHLTREYYLPVDNLTNSLGPKKEKIIYKINFNKHLNNDALVEIPILRPGDVVKVSRNNWYKFQTVLRIISQVAIIGQAYYYLSRIE